MQNFKEEKSEKNLHITKLYDLLPILQLKAQFMSVYKTVHITV